MDVRKELVELISNSGMVENANRCNILADELIENGATIQRWIPVTEQFPKTGEKVIVCRGDKVEQGVFLGVNGWWKVYGTNTKKVTHWMPMPEGPEGE